MAAQGESRRETSTLRATAHPVRLQMLSLLTGAEMSAAEIARELDITHANASYHLRVLADAGVVVEAGEERIRGGVAKRYRHPWDAGVLDRGRVAPDDAQAYVRVMADELVRRYPDRRGGERSLLADADLWVPEETWASARALLEQASRMVHDAAGRPRAAGTVRISLTVGAFELDDHGTKDADAGTSTKRKGRR